MNFPSEYSVIADRHSYRCMRQIREYFESGMRAAGIDPWPIFALGRHIPATFS